MIVKDAAVKTILFAVLLGMWMIFYFANIN
jgi:hypothetical protein